MHRTERKVADEVRGLVLLNVLTIELLVFSAEAEVNQINFLLFLGSWAPIQNVLEFDIAIDIP